MPFKRLFRDKYAGSTPENASVVRTLFDLFFLLFLFCLLLFRLLFSLLTYCFYRTVLIQSVLCSLFLCQSAPAKPAFEDDFEFVGRGPKYLDSPFDNDASLFKEDKEASSSFTARQFGKDEKTSFHSSKVTA